MHIEASRNSLLQYLYYEEDSYQGMKAVGRKDAAFLIHGGPQMVLSASDLLFPQYDGAAENLKDYSRAWLQKTAQILLKKDAKNAAPEVVARWRAIVDGSFFKK